MKNSIRLLASIAAVSVTMALPVAAKAATANATVNAKIVKPLVLTGGGTIAIGTLITPSTATFSNTFTIQPAATQTGTYCQTGFTCSGTPTAAMFNLQGTNNTPLNLTIPLTVTLTNTSWTGGGAAPTLTMTTSNSLAANNASGVYVTQLPNSGFPGTNYYVGGSLTITQATEAGSYSGTFTVTADYQ
ncbi:DUF4402 domain-containing protein [Sphingomonas rhizophila]|uniref:DUF4402 domain-containing protein n=1 Tax=Sphingomonas rhizophila TaxID=2071607 RepID=A0A7G9SAL3_9SPHN|nr:DUF4402 domain-containing protein [Sphingomonas rhizophila]QNN64888.1 DUF4402 domain-containing protein [Sphingomonas rhizophila]